MRTLYVRNVRDDVYAKLQERAKESRRSVNAFVLEILEQDAARHDQHLEYRRRLAELKAVAADEPPLDPSWAVKLIREDRDRGHKPEFGY
jgi:plasmid stability protein